MILGLGRSPAEGIGYPLQCSQASLVAQLVKNLPAMWETWVQSLGWEDPLENLTLSFPPKKGNAKECSNYCTIALISHASKVMLIIL